MRSYNLIHQSKITPSYNTRKTREHFPTSRDEDRAIAGLVRSLEAKISDYTPKRERKLRISTSRPMWDQALDICGVWQSAERETVVVIEPVTDLETKYDFFAVECKPFDSVISPFHLLKGTTGVTLNGVNQLSAYQVLNYIQKLKQDHYILSIPLTSYGDVKTHRTELSLAEREDLQIKEERQIKRSAAPLLAWCESNE